MKKYFPLIVAAIALASLAATLRTPNVGGDYDVNAFGRLPVLVNGRVKPLDTLARTSLLMMQGRQRVTTDEGVTLSPVEWMLDLVYRPHQALHYPVFEVTHPDALALLNLSPEDGAGKKRFALQQVSGKLADLDRQARLADDTESALRTTFQKAVIQLRNSVALYQRLQSSLVSVDEPDFLDQLARFERNLPAALAAMKAPAGERSHATDEAKQMLAMSRVFTTMDNFS